MTEDTDAVEDDGFLPCGNPKCDRYSLTVAEFKLLCGSDWSPQFDAKIGWAARKRCIKIYGKAPTPQRHRIACRNKVPAYPCGVLEEAYRELRHGGVALGNSRKKRAAKG